MIANGDITTVEQAAEARSRSGADGVMVGRGCYGRPWFPAQVAAFLREGERLPDPALAMQKAIMLEHYHAMLAHFGVQPGLRLGRKHVAWYSRGLHGSAEFRAAVMRCDDVPAVLELIDRLLRPADRRIPRRPTAADARAHEGRRRAHRAEGRRPRAAAHAGRGGDAWGAAGAGSDAGRREPVPLRQPRGGAVPRPVPPAADATWPWQTCCPRIIRCSP